jgi:hypothetical protein
MFHNNPTHFFQEGFMKKALLIVCALAAVLLIAGCSFSKSYYYGVSAGGYSYCQQVDTNDSDLQSSLETSGYKEGTCTANGYSGSTCSYSGTYGTDSYTITMYFGGDWAGTVYGSASAYCSYFNGTYTK